MFVKKNHTESELKCKSTVLNFRHFIILRNGVRDPKRGRTRLGFRIPIANRKYVSILFLPPAC